MGFTLLIWPILWSGEGKKTVGDIFDVYKINVIPSWHHNAEHVGLST